MNKTYGTASRGNAIRFSPIIIKRLLAILFYFTQSVGCMHTVPNMNNIDILVCFHLIQVYKTHNKQMENEGEDKGIIELPELKGHSNWTTYRDKFLSNILNITGARNIPLTYVVDESDRPRIIRASPLSKSTRSIFPMTQYLRRKPPIMARRTLRITPRCGY